jgi:hypothetical protein
VQWQFSIEPKDESSEAMRDYRVSWRGCSFLSVLEQLADRGTGRFSGNNVGERVNEKTEVEGHHSEFGATSLVKPTPLSTALLQLVLLTSSSCRRSPSSCQIPKKIRRCCVSDRKLFGSDHSSFSCTPQHRSYRHKRIAQQHHQVCLPSHISSAILASYECLQLLPRPRLCSISSSIFIHPSHQLAIH